MLLVAEKLRSIFEYVEGKNSITRWRHSQALFTRYCPRVQNSAKIQLHILGSNNFIISTCLLEFHTSETIESPIVNLKKLLFLEKLRNNYEGKLLAQVQDGGTRGFPFWFPVRTLHCVEPLHQ
jgi:hypothetical protein